MAIPLVTWRWYFGEQRTTHLGRSRLALYRTNPTAMKLRYPIACATVLLAASLSAQLVFIPDPLDIYRPASSAVGMFQIIDGTFAEARRYCIHDHVVVEDGPWHDFDSCRYGSTRTRFGRLTPYHKTAVQSASARLPSVAAAAVS